MIGKLVFLALLASAAAMFDMNPPLMNPETYGLPPSVVPMMKCTACERAMNKLKGSLSSYIIKEAKWNKATKKKVWKEIKDICLDKDVFPSTSKEELYLKACAILMRDHHDQILGAIRRRLTPDNDLFQEDILVKPFCREIEACPEGVKSMDEALSGAGANDNSNKEL